MGSRIYGRNTLAICGYNFVECTEFMAENLQVQENVHMIINRLKKRIYVTAE